MREAIAFLLLACACGAATWSGRQNEGRGARTDPDERTGKNQTGDSPDSERGTAPGATRHADRGFASLEALAASLAPGMRQAAERESAGERVELVRAGERDACVRVAFEAVAPAAVKLLDSAGTVLAEGRAPAIEGTLGDRGPVCVRKGDSVSAVAEGGGHIRWIAWASP